MPWISVVMRASMALKSVLSSSTVSSVPYTGTRSSVWPVCRMRRTASRRSRSGFSVDRVRKMPPATPMTSAKPAPSINTRRKLDSSWLRASLVLPTCKQRSAEIDRGDLENRIAIARPDLRPDRVGAAGQFRQIECAPCFRQRVQQHVFEGTDQPDEQRLARPRSLLDLDRARQRRQPARLVARRVFAQRRLDDVVIALLQQRSEQSVGQYADHDRAGEEGPEIPRRQPEAERLADPISPL